LERDIILNGVHIGEHSFDPDKVIDEINERCIKRGLNFVTIRPGYKQNRKQVPQHYFIEWAKYLAEHKIYFIFLYTVQHAPDGRESQFDAETILKMQEIAGEYFIGDMIGEVGSSMACKFAGYLLNTDYDMPITVKLIKSNKETLVTLNPLELKTVEV